MFEMCPYCKLDTAGNHWAGCPNNPVKVVNPSDYVFMGMDLSSEPDDTAIRVIITQQEYNRLRECETEIKRLRDMLKSCDPFVVNPESECQECGQGIGEIACVFCGNSIETGHAEDCRYVGEVGK